MKNINSKIFLILFCLFFLVPIVYGNIGIYAGKLYVDGVLQNDTSIPVKFYLGTTLKDTVYIGQHITNPALIEHYFTAGVPKETGEVGQVIAKVWGIQGYNSTWSEGVEGHTDITVNITKLANDAVCEENNACTSGVCCSGICKDSCIAATTYTPSGGGGGGGSSLTTTTEEEAVAPPPVIDTGFFAGFTGGDSTGDSEGSESQTDEGTTDTQVAGTESEQSTSSGLEDLTGAVTQGQGVFSSPIGIVVAFAVVIGGFMGYLYLRKR